MLPAMPWLWALAASIITVLFSGLMAWGTFYGVITSFLKRKSAPGHAESIDDYLVDAAWLQTTTAFTNILVVPAVWFVRSGSTVLQWGTSNWRLILLVGLIWWADVGIISHTNTVLKMIDNSYSHFFAEVFRILKGFLNTFRIIIDLIVPIYNLIIYCIKRIPIDVFEATLECTAPLLIQTYRTLGEVMTALVTTIDGWIERPGTYLELVPVLYDVQTYVDAVAATIRCWCKDIGDVVTVIATVLTTPSTAWAVSNATNIPLYLIVGVASNATGPPVHRPDFSPVFDAAINAITSWSLTLDFFVNSVAALLLRGEPHPTCTSVIGTNSNWTCEVDTSKPSAGCGGYDIYTGWKNEECQIVDCYYDGRDSCVFFFTPHIDYVVAKTPKVNLKVPLPFSEAGWSVIVPSKVWRFMSYTAVTWLEGIKTLLRVLINIDKLHPEMVVNSTSGNATAPEKAALWNADSVFDAWRMSNAFWGDMVFFFTNHPAVPAPIRYAPLLVNEFLNRWVDLFQLLYMVALNLIVGTVDAVEGVSSFRTMFSAFIWDWQEYFIIPADKLCYILGLFGGNYETETGTEMMYPVGCLLENACHTALQGVNNTFYLLGWAFGGAGPCQTQLPNGTRITKAHCWTHDDVTLMYQPFIEAAYQTSTCLPNLLGMWQSINSSDGSWERGNSEGNCMWNNPETKHCGGKDNPCMPTEEHYDGLKHVAINMYPQGKWSDFWSRRCINATSCVKMRMMESFANQTHAKREAIAVMESYGLTGTINGHTCSLYEKGVTGFECTNNHDCCTENFAYTCQSGDAGWGLACAGDGLIDAPCWANCPQTARWPNDALCGSCGKPFVLPTNEFAGGAPADYFAPWSQMNNYSGTATTGWAGVTRVPNTDYSQWTGCIPNECAEAAASWSIVPELWECAWYSPAEVFAHFTNDTAMQKKCALVAACNIASNHPSGLFSAHVRLQTICEDFEQPAIDSCVSVDVNLLNPLCNTGGSLAAVWNAVAVAIVGVIDSVATTVGEGVFDHKLFLMWPTREVNSITCSFKNLAVTSISIIVSTLADIIELFVGSVPAGRKTNPDDEVHPPVAMIRSNPGPIAISPDEFFNEWTTSNESWVGTYRYATKSELFAAWPNGIHFKDASNDQWARIADFCCEPDTPSGGTNNNPQCMINDKGLWMPSNSYSCQIFTSLKAQHANCQAGQTKTTRITPNWEESCRAPYPNVPICWGSYQSNGGYACIQHIRPSPSDLNAPGATNMPTDENSNLAYLSNGHEIFEEWLWPNWFSYMSHNVLSNDFGMQGVGNRMYPQAMGYYTNFMTNLQAFNSSTRWLQDRYEFAFVPTNGSESGANTQCGGDDNQDSSTCHADGAMCWLNPLKDEYVDYSYVQSTWSIPGWAWSLTYNPITNAREEKEYYLKSGTPYSMCRQYTDTVMTNPSNEDHMKYPGNANCDTGTQEGDCDGTNINMEGLFAPKPSVSGAGPQHGNLQWVETGCKLPKITIPCSLCGYGSEEVGFNTRCRNGLGDGCSTAWSGRVHIASNTGPSKAVAEVAERIC